MKAVGLLWLSSLALVAHAPSWAQSSPSMGQARSAVIHGTSPGITLIPAPGKAASAPVSAASKPGIAAASVSTPAPTPAAKPTPTLERLGGSLLRTDEPLSGSSMNSAARLSSPSIGIVLPTAASASSAASAPKR